jgi:hypothetical protein
VGGCRSRQTARVRVALEAADRFAGALAFAAAPFEADAIVDR